MSFFGGTESEIDALFDFDKPETSTSTKRKHEEMSKPYTLHTPAHMVKTVTEIIDDEGEPEKKKIKYVHLGFMLSVLFFYLSAC